MAGLLQALEGLNLSRLQGHLEVADGTVSGSISIELPDPRELLGDVGALLADPELLPAGAGDLAGLFEQGVARLGQAFELPGLDLAGEVGQDLRRLKVLVEQMIHEIGDGHHLVDKVLAGIGGLESLVGDIAGQLVGGLQLELPGNLEPFVASLKKLSAGAPLSPPEVSSLLAQLSLGLDIGRLEAPALELEAFLARLGSLGGDFAALHLEIGRLNAEVRVAIDLLSLPEPNVELAIEALGRVRGGLDLMLGATVPGAAARLAADLSTVRPEELWRPLEAKLVALLEGLPKVELRFEEIFLEPVREVAAEVAELTPEAVTAMLDGLRAELDRAVARARLDAIPKLIEELFEALAEQLRRVPLAALRSQLIGALDELEIKVREFEGFSPVWQLGEKLHGLVAKVESLDPAPIRQRIAQLGAEIQGAVDAFPIGAIKTEVEGLVAAVAELVGQASPALEELDRQLDGLAEKVAAFDFDAAGQASLDLMAEIRAKVKEVLGSGDVPAPARAAIGLAAQGLKGIHLSAEVGAPAQQVLAQLDPAAILAPIEPLLAQLHEVVETVSPKALVERLEGPYSQLTGALAQLKPALLVEGLEGELGRFSDLVGQLDPVVLVQPLQKEFEKLKQKLADATDPAPLFAPLEELYDQLLALIDRLDLGKVLEAAVRKVAELPAGVQKAVGAAVAAKAGGGPLALAEAAEPFRFGDVLRPLQLLLAQLKKAVVGMASEVLDAALGRLERAVAGLLALVDPAVGLGGRISAAVAERRAQLDFADPDGVTAELRASLAELSGVAAGLSLSVSGQARLGGAVASVQLEGRLDLSFGGSLALEPEGLLAGLAVPELDNALAELSRALERRLPAPLSQVATAPLAARLGALFDALDPSSVIAELDSLGEQILAKLQSFIKEILAGMMRIWNRVFELLDLFSPQGLLKQISAGMGRVKAELAVLDPRPIKEEAVELRDAVLEVLDAFSPAAIAGQLSGLFAAVRAKLGELDPAVLLGDLDPLAGVLASLEDLRPAKVLAPLVESTAQLQEALDKLAGVELGKALVAAVAKLQGRLEVTITGLEGELDGLLDDLGAGGSGGFDVDASVSASS
ncbi:MAG: hypothetical protein U0002_18525 [Thermoanaerobaculia bacterium]